jgi:hypothetical protein
MFLFISLYIIVYTGVVLLMTERHREEVLLEILNEKLEPFYIKPPEYKKELY